MYTNNRRREIGHHIHIYIYVDERRGEIGHKSFNEKRETNDEVKIHCTRYNYKISYKKKKIEKRKIFENIAKESQM